MFKQLTALALACLAGCSYSLPLDDYVQKDDGTFSWFDTGVEVHGRTGPANGNKTWTGRYLNVTSQSWLTPEDSSRPIWWHMVMYITPDDSSALRPVAEGENTTFLMYITGHSNGAMPDQTDEDVIATSELCIGTGLPAVIVFNVPNEKIVFPSDPEQEERGEDAIIAFTWGHFLDDMSDPSWILQLPMAKSVIKVQDAIEEYTNTVGQSEWVVSGASKRGWTTWLSAVADANYKRRYKAIVPLVYDLLNFRENLHHQWQAYGGWTFTFQDYWDQNITGRIDEDNSTVLYSIVDPFAYKDRLTLPKMVVDAAEDEFFLLDDWAYWINKDGGLPGSTHFLMNPNSEHSLSSAVLEIVPAITAFVNGLFDVGIDNIPQFTWEVNNVTGDIVVNVDEDSPLPDLVHMWHSTTCNSDRRDFRFLSLDDPCTCGVVSGDNCVNLDVFWNTTRLHPQADNERQYVAHMDAPDDGKWGAFFVDLKFRKPRHGLGWPLDGYNTYEFSTQVSIVPNEFPFPPCVGTECYGSLV